MTSEKTQEIIKAIVKTQLEITPPVKDKVNPRFKTAYSSLDSIYASVRMPLAKNGLTLSLSVELVRETQHVLRTTIFHVNGESMSNIIPLFIENLNSQGFASALTYARRYAICSLLGLPSDEDDDGEASQPAKDKISDKQIAYLEMLGSKNEMVRANIFRHHKIVSFSDLKNLDIDQVTIQQMISSLQGPGKLP